jgi:hypothetical protein
MYRRLYPDTVDASSLIKFPGFMRRLNSDGNSLFQLLTEAVVARL